MELTVNGMNCGHCVQSVTKAVQALDANAKVEIDLATKKVKLQTQASEAAVKDAINGIGFEVV